MEALNIEDRLNADLTFVKGVVKAISLLIGPISEGLGSKSKKQVTNKVKREVDIYTKKYLNIFLDLSKRYNYLLENPEEADKILSPEEYENRMREMEKTFVMIKDNLEELQHAYKLISSLAGEDVTPKEINRMIEDINWILGDKDWGNQKNVKKSEEDYKAGRFIVV